MALESKAHCYKCQTPFEFEPTGKVARSCECSSCKANLRCCKMCKFFEPSAYNECREPVAERILDKQKANFCEYFMVRLGGSLTEEKDKQLEAAMALFKK